MRRPGERVAVAGTVEFERAGFVTVRWDNGSRSTVRALDLLQLEHEPRAVDVEPPAEATS